MFSSRKPSVPAKADSPPAPAKPRAGGAPSIMSADIELVGNLSTSGDLHIDGTVNGNLRASQIIVGDSAVITGDIVADDVTIYGRVTGHLFARRIKLCNKCRVEGDIHHESLTVESGAFFDGNVRHSTDPTSAPHTQPKLLNGTTTRAFTETDDELGDEVSPLRRRL